MFYIGEIVVFGVHNHTRHVRFAVARVVGNLPVGSLHIKISYPLLGKRRVIAPVARRRRGVVGIFSAVILGRNVTPRPRIALERKPEIFRHVHSVIVCLGFVHRFILVILYAALRKIKKTRLNPAGSP